MSAKLRPKDIDLLIPYRKKDGMDQSKAALVKVAAFPAAIVLVCAVIFGALTLWTGSMDQESDELKRYIDNQEENQKYQDAQKASDLLTRYTARSNSIHQIKRRLSEYPQLNDDVFQTIIDKCSENLSVNQFSYSDTDGTLMVQLATQSLTDVPDYVIRLKNSGYFESIDYYGYDTEEDHFYLMLYCRLKAGEPADE